MAEDGPVPCRFITKPEHMSDRALAVRLLDQGDLDGAQALFDYALGQRQTASMDYVEHLSLYVVDVSF